LRVGFGPRAIELGVAELLGSAKGGPTQAALLKLEVGIRSRVLTARRPIATMPFFSIAARFAANFDERRGPRK
jgi:hypothetical protein